MPLTVRKYQIDGDDYHDPNVPSTSICPSLPGQTVNILEVPVQDLSPTAMDSSCSNASLESSVFTLDPQAKYAPLQRSATTSAVLKPKSRLSKEPSDLSHGLGRPGSDLESRTNTAQSAYQGPALCKQSGQEPVFQRFRRSIASRMGDGDEPPSRLNSSWSRRLFSRSSRSRKGKPDVDVPEVPKIPDDFLSQARNDSFPASAPHNLTPQTERKEEAQHSADAKIDSGRDEVLDTSMSLAQLRSALPEAVRDDSALARRPSSSRYSNNLDVPCSTASAGQGQAAYTSLALSDLHVSCMDDTSRGQVEVAAPAMHEFAHSEEVSPRNDRFAYAEQDLEHLVNNRNATDSVAFSYTSSEYMLPCLTSNTNNSRRRSSVMLSMPDTPQMADFDCAEVGQESNSDAERDCATHGATAAQDGFPTQGGEVQDKLGRFQGYSLPIHDHASSMTITKPTTHEHGHPELRRQASAQLVQSWDDGAQHHIGALSTLVEDMGYLGTLIN